MKEDIIIRDRGYLMIMVFLVSLMLLVPTAGFYSGVQSQSHEGSLQEPYSPEKAPISWNSSVPIIDSTDHEIRPSITHDGYKYHVMYANEYSQTDYDIIDCRSSDYYSDSTTHIITSSTKNSTDPTGVYYHEGKELWGMWSNDQQDIWYKVSYDGGTTWDGPWSADDWDTASDGKVQASSNSAYPSKVYTTFVIPADRDYITGEKNVVYELYNSGDGKGWYDAYSFTYDGTNPSRIADVSSVIGDDGYVYSFWIREKKLDSTHESHIEYRRGPVSSSPISWSAVESVFSDTDKQHRTAFSTAYDSESDDIYLFYTEDNSSMVDINYMISRDHGETWTDPYYTGVSLDIGTTRDIGIDTMIKGGEKTISLVYEDSTSDIHYMQGEIVNRAPSSSDPMPNDGAEGVSTDANLSVSVSDPDADNLDVTFYNASDDSIIGSESGVKSGSTAYTNWSGLEHGRNYSWYVKVDDGNAISTVGPWNFTTLFLQEIQLDYREESKGWNFISCNLIPDDKTITTRLTDENYGISGNYSKLMYYDAGEDEWVTYMPDRSDIYNDLRSWNRTMGLWIQVDSDVTLGVEGLRPENTTIALKPGWNMVGYPSNTNRIASNVLPQEITKLGIFNRNAPYNLEYVYDFSTEVLVASRGYWVYNGADQKVQWTIDY